LAVKTDSAPEDTQVRLKRTRIDEYTKDKAWVFQLDDADFTSPNTVFEFSACVPTREAEFKLTVKDKEKDGFEEGAYYTLVVDGVTLLDQTRLIGNSQTHVFSGVDSTASPTGVPSVAPTPIPTVAPVPATKAPIAPCVDDPDFAYKGDSEKKCDWAGENSKRCEKTYQGLPIYAYCPETCDVCSASPTAAPISPTEAPVEGPPTTPCNDDSDFKFKGDGQKDCDWVGEKPSERCEKEWKQIPLSNYCPETCDICSASPTAAPTAAIYPTETPVASPPPTATPPCVDDDSFSWKGNGCEWVAGKPDKRCDKLYKQTTPLSVYCPVTCDSCDL